MSDYDIVARFRDLYDAARSRGYKVYLDDGLFQLWEGDNLLIQCHTLDLLEKTIHQPLARLLLAKAQVNPEDYDLPREKLVEKRTYRPTYDHYTDHDDLYYEGDIAW